MLRESSKLFAVNRGLFCPLIRIIISHCKDPYEPTCNVVRVLKVSQMLWTFGQCIYSKYSLYSKHESLRHEIPSVASISLPRMRRGTSRRICENGDCTAHDPSEGFTAVTKRSGIDFEMTHGKTPVVLVVSCGESVDPCLEHSATTVSCLAFHN